MTKFKYFLSICILLISVCFFCMFNFKKSNSQKTEVVFWTVQLSTFSDYMNNVIDKFEKQYPNIKIKWVDVPYAEAEKRVLASLLSNSMPDLINITSDFNMTLASKGALSKADYDEVYPKLILNSVMYNNEVMGVPFYATSAITVYNKELVDEFGVKSIPSSYFEMFDVIKKSTKLNNKYLFMPTLTENDTLYKMLNKYSLTTVDNIESSKTSAFFKSIKELYDDGKLPKESITQTHREVLEKYSAGQIAFLQVGANFLNIIKENSVDVYNKTDVDFQLVGEKEAYDFSLMTLAVPLKSENPKEAFLFAKFLTNEENQLEFAKLTGVLPCNKYALANKYFKTKNDKDLITKARVLGAKQLLSPIFYPQQMTNHKDLIVLINKTIEQILLENKDISLAIAILKQNWINLIQN